MAGTNIPRNHYTPEAHQANPAVGEGQGQCATLFASIRRALEQIRERVSGANLHDDYPDAHVGWTPQRAVPWPRRTHAASVYVVTSEHDARRHILDRLGTKAYAFGLREPGRALICR